MATEAKQHEEGEKVLGELEHGERQPGGSKPWRIEAGLLEDREGFLKATENLLDYSKRQHELLSDEEFREWATETLEGEEFASSLAVAMAGIVFLAGQYQVDQGAWQRALEDFRTALDSFRIIQNAKGKAVVFLALGDVHQKFGDYELARMYYGDAERHFRQVGDKTGEAMAWLRAGTVELQMQDIAAAKSRIQAASDYFHAVGDEERAKLSDEWLALVQRVEQGASEEIPA